MEDQLAPLILVVDDDEQLRDVYSRALEGAGYRTVTAENGADGVEKAKELLPDLILMDYEMPIKNGVEALAALRADPATAELKVVFLTAFGEASGTAALGTDTKFAQESGALDFLKKDSNLSDLIAKVKKYLSV